MKQGKNRPELSPLEKFCLDAYLANGDARTAYTLSRKEPEITAKDDSLAVLTSRWLNSNKVKDYLALRRTAAATNTEAQETANRTRDDAISELNRLATASTNPKERSQILLALADLQKWKREEDANKDKQVVFYIPLQVDRCIEFFARILAVEFRLTQEQEDRAVELMSNPPDTKDIPTRDQLNEQIRQEGKG